MDSSMFCKCCKTSKSCKDFIGIQEDCYKCVYARKVMEAKKIKKNAKCKICETPLPPNRWSYCCLECAVEGKRRNHHWTYPIRNNSKGFKKRFIFK